MEIFIALISSGAVVALLKIMEKVAEKLLERKGESKKQAEADRKIALAELKGAVTCLTAEVGKLMDNDKVILHDRLMYLCTKHLLATEITVQELSNMNELYKAYAQIGGNGDISSMMERVRALTIVRYHSAVCGESCVPPVRP